MIALTMDDGAPELVPSWHLRPDRQCVRTSGDHDLVKVQHLVLSILSGEVHIPPRVILIAEHYADGCIELDILMKLEVGGVGLEELRDLRACQVWRPICRVSSVSNNAAASPLSGM